jgi:hypothetical protein
MYSQYNSSSCRYLWCDTAYKDHILDMTCNQFTQRSSNTAGQSGPQAALCPSDAAKEDLLLLNQPAKVTWMPQNLMCNSVVSVLDPRAPTGFDLILGDRSGRIALCALNHLEPSISRTELSQRTSSPITEAFAITSDALAARSTTGEMIILRRNALAAWNEEFRSSPGTAITSCVPLPSNTLALTLGDGRLCTLEDRDGAYFQSAAVSLPGHVVTKLISLTERSGIALTSKRTALVVDDITRPNDIQALPSPTPHSPATLHRLSASAFAMCRVSGVLECWQRSEDGAWSGTFLDFPQGDSRIVARLSFDRLLVRSNDQLYVAQVHDGAWTKSLLDDSCDTTGATALDPNSFVVGGFRGGVTLWTRTGAETWAAQPLSPHSGMVTTACRSRGFSFVTASYDHSLRWWI